MTYSITKDDYFDRQQPSKSEELRNSVTVVTQPIAESDEDSEIYRSESPVSVPAVTTIVVDCEYNSFPVILAEAVLEDESVGITLSDVEYYAWGARVTLENIAVTSGTCVIVITGTAMAATGGETVTESDADSITENGLQLYEYPTNPLIQTRAMAILIAYALLASYKDFRKDCALQWRGDPACELGDIVEVPEYQRGAIDIKGDFYIVKNKIDFDGTVKETTDGRKVPAVIP